MPPPHRPPPLPPTPPLPLGTNKILSVCTTALYTDCFGVKTEYGTPKRSVAEFFPRPRLSTARRNDQQSSPDPVNITGSTTSEAAAAPPPPSSSPSPHPPPKSVCRAAAAQLPVPAIRIVSYPCLSVCLSCLSGCWLAVQAQEECIPKSYLAASSTFFVPVQSTHQRHRGEYLSRCVRCVAQITGRGFKSVEYSGALASCTPRGHPPPLTRTYD